MSIQKLTVKSYFSRGVTIVQNSSVKLVGTCSKSFPLERLHLSIIKEIDCSDSDILFYFSKDVSQNF
jgi:hypothetical protein